MHTEQLLKSDLVAVEDAAKALGMDPKRFMGFCMSRKAYHPISDGKLVYGWSCVTLADRLRSIKSGATP